MDLALCLHVELQILDSCICFHFLKRFRLQRRDAPPRPVHPTVCMPKGNVEARARKVLAVFGAGATGVLAAFWYSPVAVCCVFSATTGLSLVYTEAFGIPERLVRFDDGTCSSKDEKTRLRKKNRKFLEGCRVFGAFVCVASTACTVSYTHLTLPTILLV